MHWPDLAVALAARIAPVGFDVFGAVTVGAYNRTLEEHLSGYRLPDLGSDRALVLVVGNTRRLWPLFLAAYVETSLAIETHPLDAYSRLHIGTAVAELARDQGTRHALRYSFDLPPNAVAIQRLAVLAGAAEVAPVGLCIHPLHGPWLSLRAAAIFDIEGPEATAPQPTCSVCTARSCLAARDRVLATTGVEGVSRETFEANWRTWLGMRDACPVGREQRYSDQQVRYHYLKRLPILREPAAREL